VVNRPSMQTSSLTASAPARRRSVHRLGQEVIRCPRTTSASIRVHGLWQMAAIGLPVPANSLTKLDRIPVDAQQVGGPPDFPDRYDVGVVALSDDLHIFARFGEPVPEHGAPATVTTGFLRTEADRPVYGPVFAPGGGPASRQAGEARRGPATAGPAAWPEPASLAVSVSGVATTSFGRLDRPAEELAAEAALTAVADAGQAGQGRVDVAEPRRTRAGVSRPGGPFPRQAQVCRQRPGEAELGVRSHDDPGPTGSLSGGRADSGALTSCAPADV